jgi:hypothetical protein
MYQNPELILDPELSNDLTNLTGESYQLPVYEVKSDAFRSFIRFDPKVNGPINGELYDGDSSPVIRFEGSLLILGKLGLVSNIYGLKDVNSRQGLQYCAAILLGVQEALIHERVKKLKCSTHQTLAKLLNQMGWEMKGKRQTQVILEIDLQKTGIIVPRILR